MEINNILFSNKNNYQPFMKKILDLGFLILDEFLLSSISYALMLMVYIKYMIIFVKL